MALAVREFRAVGYRSLKSIAYAGADAARVCHEQAAKAYADCLRTGKKSDVHDTIGNKRVRDAL